MHSSLNLLALSLVPLIAVAGMMLFSLGPKLEPFTPEDLAGVSEYHNRLNRNGIEPVLDYTKRRRIARFASHARITEGAKEKRVIYLPGRTL